jgi:hypothetical protein
VDPPRRLHLQGYVGEGRFGSEMQGPISGLRQQAVRETTATTPAEPLSFRADKDLAPQKRRLSGVHSDNRHCGVPAGKMSDR